MMASHLAGGKVLDRRHVLDTGIVDEDVDPAEGFAAASDHFGDVSGLRHVGGRIGDRDAERLPSPCGWPSISSGSPKPLNMTAAPAAARARAIPSPMPLVEPVMIADLVL